LKGGRTLFDGMLLFHNWRKFFFLYSGDEKYIVSCANLKGCARIGDKLQLVAKSNTNCKIKGQA